jgi:hypothetical protein
MMQWRNGKLPKSGDVGSVIKCAAACFRDILQGDYSNHSAVLFRDDRLTTRHSSSRHR